MYSMEVKKLKIADFLLDHAILHDGANNNKSFTL